MFTSTGLTETLTHTYPCGAWARGNLKIQRSKKGHFSSDEVMNQRGDPGNMSQCKEPSLCLEKKLPTMWTPRLTETKEAGECT